MSSLTKSEETNTAYDMSHWPESSQEKVNKLRVPVLIL